MRSSLLTAAFAPAALGATQPRNFIYIIPDGLAPASETLVRAYEALMSGNSTPSAPLINPIPIDQFPIGNVRTSSANDLVTDSAAAGTALAAGHKTINGFLGFDAEERPIGTILEAAKMAGMKTGLVATSRINHATPAAFSSHTLSRNGYPVIAEQLVGYSHPLNYSVDVLLGGGSCYFKPSSDPDSCREDEIDLISHSEASGYYITEDRTGFEILQNGNVSLPYLGLFSNDTEMSYEIDRRQQPLAEREPSLEEMSEVALTALTQATACKDSCDDQPGYFIMIEASRIDHSSHANDPAAHLHDVLEYNRVVDFVKNWIDSHTDTAMIAVADHETGGLTLPSGYDPRPLAGANHSAEYLYSEFSDYTGNDLTSLVSDQLEAYGIKDANETVINDLTESSDYEQTLVDLLSAEAGLAWSTGGHTAVDVTLYAYAAGEKGEELVKSLSGNHDNTDLPRFIEKYLGLDMDEVTRKLREDVSWWE